MSFQKFYLIAEKNLSKVCEKNMEDQASKSSIISATPKNEIDSIKKDNVIDPTDNLSPKKNSFKNADNNVQESNSFKETEEPPKLEENSDLDKKLELPEVSAPPPGVPNTKRKRVIEGNLMHGGSQILPKNCKKSKKINWIQL